MNIKGFRHICLLCPFQIGDQIFGGHIFVMMAGVAGIGLLVQTARLQGGLGEHESEGVAVCVPRLTDACYSGHMATHATAECVDSMDRAVLLCRMTAFAELILEQPGL